MIRQTVAHVDLDAVRSNFRTISEFLATSRTARAPGIIAVVKANAATEMVKYFLQEHYDLGVDLTRPDLMQGGNLWGGN